MDPINDQICQQVLRWRGLPSAVVPAETPATDSLAGRRVLVTGSAGSIGGQIAQRLSRGGVDHLALLDVCEAGQFRLDRSLASSMVGREMCLGDITDGPFLEDVFQRLRPDVVLHAAAYKHVPLLEGHPRAAVRANVLGTARLAEAAERWGCERFVMISTDKAVSPVGVMGATKMLAELYLRSRSEHAVCSFSSVRFGNVIETSGNVFETFACQLAQGSRLTVTDPRAERYFMTLHEAVELVLRSVTIGCNGQVLVLNMGEPVRIDRIARYMAKLADIDPDTAVEFIGLRPGERLDENLFEVNERRVPTKQPGIDLAIRKSPSLSAMDDIVAMFEEVVRGPVEGVGESLSLAMTMVSNAAAECEQFDAG